jgi:hypothetical protein
MTNPEPRLCQNCKTPLLGVRQKKYCQQYNCVKDRWRRANQARYAKRKTQIQADPKYAEKVKLWEEKKLARRIAKRAANPKSKPNKGEFKAVHCKVSEKTYTNPYYRQYFTPKAMENWRNALRVCQKYGRLYCRLIIRTNRSESNPTELAKPRISPDEIREAHKADYKAMQDPKVAAGRHPEWPFKSIMTEKEIGERIDRLIQAIMAPQRPEFYWGRPKARYLDSSSMQ